MELSVLQLTSPPMTGDAVRETQLVLRHNPYGIFDPGAVEGVYDEQTAAAVRRANLFASFCFAQAGSNCVPSGELLRLAFVHVRG